MSGFSVTRSAKGIVLDGSQWVTIDGVEVSRTDTEAVHFRSSSSDNVIKNSFIHDTGLHKPQYGEAVYLGSAKSNWKKYGKNGGPDRSNRNQVLDNTIGPNVTAEHLDIKEGTQGGVVRGNRFDGDGISGDSWVDVKGNGYRIENNTGTFGGDGALVDGYQTHKVVDKNGYGNTFTANTSDLGGADGFAINVTNQRRCGNNPTIVTCNNTIRNAGSGLTNISLS